ncbi:MAG: hypothetical protein KDC83_15380 [Flavobacteriales bacterium]|nr:hypothetical protein [Flavobacteriales bacterium]
MKKEKLFGEFEPFTKADWINKLEKDLKGKPYSDLTGTNLSGIAIEPIYHTESPSPADEAPGSGSFRRSSKSTSNEWVIEEEFKLTGQPKQDNAEILKRLNAGLTGICTYGNPTTETLKNILPEYIALGFCGYSDLSVLTQNLNKAFPNPDKTNLSRFQLNFDPIGNSAQTGNWTPLSPSILADVEVLKPYTGWRLFSVNAQEYHNSGGNAVSELAFALAHAHEYLVFLMENGKSIDDASALIKIQLGIGGDYFSEIAKIRAFRMLWSQVISAYSPKHECSKTAYIQSISSQFLSTVYDPYVNMLRGTTQAMSAVLGGADIIRILPFDTAFSTGDSFSHRIARNVQIVLQEESYFDKVIDPAGGSYYIEYLTNELARKAWEKFQKIEKKGGFLGLMTSGNLARELKEDAQAQLDLLNMGKSKILGVTLYPNKNEKALDKIPELLENEFEENPAFAPIELLRLAGELEESRLSEELKEADL